MLVIVQERKQLPLQAWPARCMCGWVLVILNPHVCEQLAGRIPRAHGTSMRCQAFRALDCPKTRFSGRGGCFAKLLHMLSPFLRKNAGEELNGRVHLLIVERHCTGHFHAGGGHGLEEICREWSCLHTGSDKRRQRQAARVAVAEATLVHGEYALVE